MTNPNDLIRRGDVAKAIATLAQEFIDGGSPTAAHVLNLASDRINTIPAVQPTVSPDVAALVVAAEEALSEIEAGDVTLVVIRDLRSALARATLAEIKGETK